MAQIYSYSKAVVVGLFHLKSDLWLDESKLDTIATECKSINKTHLFNVNSPF